MPVNETGHARNVEHFATMISFVDGYGGVYKLKRHPAIFKVSPAAVSVFFLTRGGPVGLCA